MSRRLQILSSIFTYRARSLARPAFATSIRLARASSNSESATVALRHFPQIDRLGLDAHFETLPQGAEDCGQVIHARIALGRQHSMQALAGHIGELGQLLEPQGCIHKIAQNEPRSLWLATQE